MPLYEYISQSDGERIELLRPMSAADDPVEDPAKKGRTFKRIHSTFAAQGGEPGKGKTVSLTGGGGGCPCGKAHGSCKSN